MHGVRTSAVLSLLVLVAASGAGCLDPHRVHVPAEVLQRAPVPWQEQVLEPTSDGLFGPNTIETRYRFDPAQEGPPFPGILQVFSVRRLEAESRDALFSQAQQIVAKAMEREAIAEDESARQSGERSLRSGVETKWFARTGHVQSEGGLFDEDVEVMVLGEVGYDGRSRTEFLVVALVQTAQTVDIGCNPVLPGCTDVSRRSDMTTWRSVVRDPVKTLGHEGNSGLVWNLVTHG